MAGTVYAIGSGKGGVGKTTTVVNLGVALHRLGHSVALIEADLAMPNLATPLGVKYEPTIHEVLAGKCTVDEALFEGADGFGILIGNRSLESFGEIEPTELADVIDYVSEQYEYVLVDTGGGLGYDEILTFGVVDELILVTTPNTIAISDTRRTAEIATKVDCPIRGIIINRVKDSVNATSISDEIGSNLLGIVPEDETIDESYDMGKPVYGIDPESPSARAYLEIGKTLVSNHDTTVQGVGPVDADQESKLNANTKDSTPSVDIGNTSHDSIQSETKERQSDSADGKQIHTGSDTAGRKPATDQANPRFQNPGVAGSVSGTTGEPTATTDPTVEADTKSDSEIDPGVDPDKPESPGAREQKLWDPSAPDTGEIEYDSKPSYRSGNHHQTGDTHEGRTKDIEALRKNVDSNHGPTAHRDSSANNSQSTADRSGVLGWLKRLFG